MGAVVWGGVKVVSQFPLAGKTDDVIVVLGLIPIACATYGALLWIFKIEGREEVETLVAKFRARFTRV